MTADLKRNSSRKRFLWKSSHANRSATKFADIPIPRKNTVDDLDYSPGFRTLESSQNVLNSNDSDPKETVIDLDKRIEEIKSEQSVKNLTDSANNSLESTRGITLSPSNSRHEQQPTLSSHPTTEEEVHAINENRRTRLLVGSHEKSQSQKGILLNGSSSKKGSKGSSKSLLSNSSKHLRLTPDHYIYKQKETAEVTSNRVGISIHSQGAPQSRLDRLVLHLGTLTIEGFQKAPPRRRDLKIFRKLDREARQIIEELYRNISIFDYEKYAGHVQSHRQFKKHNMLPLGALNEDRTSSSVAANFSSEAGTSNSNVAFTADLKTSPNLRRDFANGRNGKREISMKTMTTGTTGTIGSSIGSIAQNAKAKAKETLDRLKEIKESISFYGRMRLKLLSMRSLNLGNGNSESSYNLIVEANVRLKSFGIEALLVKREENLIGTTATVYFILVRALLKGHDLPLKEAYSSDEKEEIQESSLVEQ